MYYPALFAFLCSFLAVEAVLNYRDEYYPIKKTADRLDWSNHPCKRRCVKDEQPKVCEYTFVVEMWSAMNKACYNCPFNITDCFRPHCISAAGIQKPVYSVNRQLPGPTIEVCQNDRIVVDVRNIMLSETTTVHWHGMKQKATPYMDGVPYVNQCPIQPEAYFQYDFRATEAGTFFYHSHIGTQRPDGFLGALVVHPTESPQINHHYGLYDYDMHHIIINDWTPGFTAAEDNRNFQDRFGIVPVTVLINGLGRYDMLNRTVNGTIQRAYAPTALFEVEPGKRYRMRLINAGSANCPMEFSIDGHVMKVISLDSKDIKPVEVEEITIWAGERVDFILRADMDVRNYWMRVRGLSLCAASNTSRGAFQVARLHYKGASFEDPPEPVGWNIPDDRSMDVRVLNPFDIGTEVKNRSNVNIPDLISIEPSDPCLESNNKNIHQIYLSFDFYPLDNYDYHRRNLYGFNQVLPGRSIGSLQFNHISLKMTSFPLLSQYEDIKDGQLCNDKNYPKGLNCTADQCACTHVIPVALNSVVELIFVDEGRFFLINHPLHLHGHFFRVVASRKLNTTTSIEQVRQLDREGKIKRRLDDPPLKDTFKTPGGGYSIVRFYADNPGYWFFHCHFEDHMNIGMALIFKVGEHKDFAPKPMNFPRCGNFPPDNSFKVRLRED